MKKYVVQNGIWLIEIQGIYLLAADREGRKFCPYLRQLNEVGVFVWKDLEKEKSTDEICSHIRQEFEVPESVDIGKDVISFLELLKECNYVIEKEF